MATTLQEILERYEHEHASTHAVIGAMTDAHASFRPHERAMSWAQLAWHVATTPLYYAVGPRQREGTHDDGGAGPGAR